jgi:hypothetical protein
VLQLSLKVMRDAIAGALALGNLFDEPWRGPRLARKRVEQTGGGLGGARGLVQDVPESAREPREANGRRGGGHVTARTSQLSRRRQSRV